MKRRNKFFLMVTLLLGVWLTQPTGLQACTACFGGDSSNSPMVQGMGWGIFALLCTIAGVLSGIAMFFVHVIRREAALTSSAPEALATPKN